MSATEALQVLQVSRSTLTRMIKEGRIVPVNPHNPNLKRPRALRFDRAQVLALAPRPRSS